METIMLVSDIISNLILAALFLVMYGMIFYAVYRYARRVRR